jgi:hypothetical protein
MPTSGHYVCFVRSGNDSWYRISDALVSAATEDEVLKQTAYLLFYQRIVPRGIQVKGLRTPHASGKASKERDEMADVAGRSAAHAARAEARADALDTAGAINAARAALEPCGLRDSVCPSSVRASVSPVRPLVSRGGTAGPPCDSTSVDDVVLEGCAALGGNEPLLPGIDAASGEATTPPARGSGDCSGNEASGQSAGAAAKADAGNELHCATSQTASDLGGNRCSSGDLGIMEVCRVAPEYTMHLSPVREGLRELRITISVQRGMDAASLQLEEARDASGLLTHVLFGQVRARTCAVVPFSAPWALRSCRLRAQKGVLRMHYGLEITTKAGEL